MQSVNLWLKQRADMYAYYANNVPQPERVKMEFQYPDAGWIDAYISKERMQEPALISLSYIGEPFCDYLKWLENIVDNEKTFSQCPSIMINNPDTSIGRRLIFSYEPIALYSGWTNCRPHPHECGIFSIYDELEQKLIIHAYCSTKQFVHDRYTELISFMQFCAQSTTFFEDWIQYAFDSHISDDERDEEATKKFFAAMKSSILEKYLRSKGYPYQKKMST